MSQNEFARDLVPSDYGALPMLRLFLPLIGADNQAQPWSSYLTNDLLLSGSIEWREVWDAFVSSGTSQASKPIPARGQLDSATSMALYEAISLKVPPESALHCLRWVGYSDTKIQTDSKLLNQFGHDFSASDEPLAQIIQRAVANRIPEFLHDDEGFLAWGTNLYADSLIIASCEPIHTALMNDPRLDTVQINKETDVLPVSSGD